MTDKDLGEQYIKRMREPIVLSPEDEQAIERLRTPKPPENVCIVQANGAEIPCKVRYVGERIADDGRSVHEWEALSEYPLDISAGDRLKIGILPSRCSLAFRVEGVK